MLNIEKVRADTPAALTQHYLHNAGASLMPAVVVEAIKQHLDLEASIGGYAAAHREADRLDSLYDSVARLVNADRDEIAITENATVAWQLAFYSLPFAPGDRILTAEAEYGANYVAYLQVCQRRGVAVEVVPSDSEGALDVAALDDMIDERVKLISMTWVPTNGGLVNPAAQVGEVARRHGITYLLDACQAVGQLRSDVRELQCDILTATGRKFVRGPRGTGFLYVRRSLLQRLEPPVIDHFSAPWVARDQYELRPDARRFETWENNYAARLGLAAAVDYALDTGIDAIEDRCRYLGAYLRRALETIPGVTLLDLGRDPCAIVSFTVKDTPPDSVVDAAAAAGVTIGLSAPASTRIDAERRALPVLLRASPHYYNTESDLDTLAGIVARQALSR